jgi:D-sedoheptulose 7-phosphate isomerase
MDLYHNVTELFHSHIDVAMRSLEELPEIISECGELLNHCLLSEHKILCCGEGAAGALAQIFSSNLLNRYDYERPSLPAIALSADATSITAITSDSSFSDIYARQIRALGQPGDILLLISCSAPTGSSLQAIQAAHDRNMVVVSLYSGDQPDAAALLLPEDLEICIPTDNRARAIETQLTVLHCLCELIDHQLFGSQE